MPWQPILIILGFAAFLAGVGIRIVIPGFEIDLKNQLSDKARRSIAALGFSMAAFGFLSMFGVISVPDDAQTHTLQLPGYYEEAGPDGCFARTPGSNLVLGDDPPVVEDIISCEYRSPGQSGSRTYEFSLPEFPPGAEITALSGVFGIDEAGGVEHPGAQALWAVYQGGRQLCDVFAEWKRPGRCNIEEPVDLVQGEPLIVTGRLVPSEKAQDGESVFLGIARPRLVVRV